MPTVWTLLWLINAAAFTFQLHRQRYGRLWLALVAALLIGPVIWLWWGYLVWRDTTVGRRVLRRKQDAI